MQEIKITKTTTPKQKPQDETALGFGRIFTDHMFLMNYEEGKGWINARIVPYGCFDMDPAAMVLHYGQAIFEGTKCYRREDGGLQLRQQFRFTFETRARAFIFARQHLYCGRQPGPDDP